MPCNKGIGIVLIKTKELIQYLENDENCFCKKLCLNKENSVFALFNKYKNYEEIRTKTIYVNKYEIIDNNLQQIQNYKSNDVFINDNECTDILCENNENLIIYGKSLYPLDARCPFGEIFVIRKSHINKSGKCYLKLKYANDNLV